MPRSGGLSPMAAVLEASRDRRWCTRGGPRTGCSLRSRRRMTMRPQAFRPWLSRGGKSSIGLLLRQLQLHAGGHRSNCSALAGRPAAVSSSSSVSRSRQGGRQAPAASDAEMLTDSIHPRHVIALKEGRQCREELVAGLVALPAGHGRQRWCGGGLVATHGRVCRWDPCLHPRAPNNLSRSKCTKHEAYGWLRWLPSGWHGPWSDLRWLAVCYL